MNTNKKNNTILFTIFGIVLIVVVGLLVFFANRPKTDDSSASSTNTSSSSQKVNYPTNYTLNAAVKNSSTALNDLTLPQLSTTVGEDEAEVQIKTSAGNINIKLFPKLAPNAVQNFLVLAKHGYYKNNEFFRVIKDFMIQSGDPSNKGTGTASIFGGKTFDTEISNQLYNIRGALALANTGQASSSSSQFFIVQNPQDMTSQIQDKSKYSQKIIDAYKKGGYPSLDGSYTVFGQVISGMDVVDKIAKADVKTNSSGESSAPIDPVKIKSVKILKDWKF
ncbi:LPXTG cell wall anchor domain protein [Lactococcus cremoris]|jgi:peptidyl-prolyl cis-trans isomerase A (cyclophilin A)|uniref:Peptidyl-prolyl cis-trans isomerase n=1 Tax=Lactococcus cremoris subsp. cremoris IBB477 TaxID=1449093 RepID=A0A1E7G6P4_LACLC|nr:peptidylprolyl isomerase [Lactococcus cremoris]MCI1842055.1 peptidylprolyl isomerase [Lactococcus lactis]KKW74335.1 LPXTG cell wall anchor domain protein [Lactococcus cremoris]KZK06787.1 Peptidyl-prolyl cis-trans isomerase [Lactococcus cremoris]MCT0455389.1 peptidylprolyl isomerase [Lactococcus cremoris]MCT0473812.1 peptidylprolyl isomerase [Lactococcus cremoris]